VIGCVFRANGPQIRPMRARAAGHILLVMSPAPILICYDGSDGAARAIAAAGALLGKRRAVVLDVGSLELVAEEYAALGSDAVDFETGVQADAAARAEAGAALARTAGFDAAARSVLEAPAWRGVVELADDIGAAAIVLGSRGLTGLRALLEGSFAHLVATHARRPVLVVPPLP
jgi:nucleotide-binding universal stress UspA family protein